MSRIAPVAVFIAVCLLFADVTHAQNLLNAPEGIVFDYEHNRYLVSNWNSGAVVAIDSNGSQSYLRGGLGNCSGMLILDGILYVSCTNTNLIGLDLETGATVFDMHLSYSGLHGIAADTAGLLYVADWSTNNIYKVDPVAQTSQTLAHQGLSKPLGLEYDAANHRLIVVSYGSNNWIQSVDCLDGTVEYVLNTGFPNLDDITRDQDGWYYVSAWDDYSNQIYRYDSTFTDPPELIVSNDNHGLIDICYNRRDNILAHTDYWTNTAGFEQMKVAVSPDSTHGWIPFEVPFEGSCEFGVAEWRWDFGDGRTSTGQNPTVSFDTRGMYDITLDVVTTDGDTLTRFMRRGVTALADTVAGADTTAPRTGTVIVPISLTNTAPLREIIVPIEYGGGLNLTLDSFSTAGCRTDYFALAATVHSSVAGKQLTVRLLAAISGVPVELEPGSGPILNLHFRNQGAGPGETVPINLAGYDTHVPYAAGNLLAYEPAAVAGSVTVPVCCFDERGDVDMSGAINVSDLTWLVAYLFQLGPEPVCPEEGDVDGSGVVNVSDITYLVGYLFQAGPVPALCP